MTRLYRAFFSRNKRPETVRSRFLVIRLTPAEVLALADLATTLGVAKTAIVVDALVAVGALPLPGKAGKKYRRKYRRRPA